MPSGSRTSDRRWLGDKPAFLHNRPYDSAYAVIEVKQFNCIEGEDNPWYPSMRVFRQSGLDDWGPVFAQMRTAVNELLTR